MMDGVCFQFYDNDITSKNIAKQGKGTEHHQENSTLIHHCRDSVPKSFHRENFSGPAPTESVGTQDSENISWFG